MKCVVCGMNIKSHPVTEEIDGTIYHYCCTGCLESGICQRDKPLRKLQKKIRVNTKEVNIWQ